MWNEEKYLFSKDKPSINKSLLEELQDIFGFTTQSIILLKALMLENKKENRWNNKFKD